MPQQAMLKSDVWGGTNAPITQGFDTYDPSTASMYDYVTSYGLSAGHHGGLDIGVPKGTRIYSIDYGTVERSGFDPNNFRPKPVYMITEDDPNTPANEAGYEIVFGHLWDDTVKVGDKVVPGQMVGYSGEQTVKGTMTPDGTGPHLHFELRQPGANTESGYRLIDPTDWLTKHKAPSNQAPGGAVLVPNNPDGSVPDSSSGGGLSGGIGDILGIGTILGTIGQYAGRAMFILIGAGVLLIGLQAVMSSGGGGRSGGTGIVRKLRKTAINAVPATRIAQVAVQHGKGPIQIAGARHLNKVLST